MTITRVTITGADNNSSVDEMIRLSQNYDFVEWGILFGSQTNIDRFPDERGLVNLYASLLPGNNIKLSGHLCGKYSRQVLENNDFTFVEFLNRFERIQLNYNFGNSSNKWLIGNLINYVSSPRNRHNFILQWNKSNQKQLYPYHKDGQFNYIHLLYDSSGGRGKEIEYIQEPLNTIFTGYSGGIGPDNIDKVISAIENTGNDKYVWIDMESKVRTDNKLDFNKVEEILKKVQQHIKKQSI